MMNYDPFGKTKPTATPTDYGMGAYANNQIPKPVVENYTYNPIAPPNFNYTQPANLQAQLLRAQQMFNSPMQFQTAQRAPVRQATPLNQYVTGLLGQSK
jgi:hypothetical protein